MVNKLKGLQHRNIEKLTEFFETDSEKCERSCCALPWVFQTGQLFNFIALGGVFFELPLVEVKTRP
jgi:hypothetical protein